MSKRNILISSAGRRNQLIECFRQDAQALGLDLRVLAADIDPPLSPACNASDGAIKVLRCTEPQFIDQIRQVCEREKVGLVVPTIDTELIPYAENMARFLGIGTRVLVSDPTTVMLARDKLGTARVLAAKGIWTPKTLWWRELKAEPQRVRWPVIVKPNGGSASQRIRHLADPSEGWSLADAPDLIAQEEIKGPEYTVNMFISQDGSLQAVVPHRRIEVRSGEVSKAQTERHTELQSIAEIIAATLPGARGPLCFQAIHAEDGRWTVFEINARFGGGYPLAHHAGAHFTRWILEELLGVESTANNNWRDGAMMLRYDSAIFL